ncbi:MAG: hypothetical protein HOW73_40035 [Polyangiaceae bacterium]|nr:hypothetical protein [Polyangiaceae bacterium]
MSKRIQLCVAVLGISAAALSGCGVRGAVEIPNPLITGAVSPNEAKQHRFWYESMNGLPYRSASTEASLVSLDDTKACFDVKLRWLYEVGAEKEDETFVDVNKLIPKLEIMEPEETMTKSEVKSAKEIERSELVGKVTETITEQQQVCDGNGRNCYQVNIQRQIPKDKPFTVMDSGGVICFEHDGHIKKSTEAMILTLAVPEHQDKASHRFAWKFDNE